jgi:succinoglycan biosynthesis transport protein ExoP
LENTRIRLQDILAIIQRRKLLLLIPLLTIVGVAAAIALLLPPVYKSSSTILIEDQEIPSEYVHTTVTSYVEKRLQEIKQKIMSTTRLLEIIDKYELYTDLKKRKTTEEIVEKMRDDISLKLISAEVIDKHTGQNTNATIAFTLSYQGKNDPAKVQRVASVLASLFLEENIKVREKQVREASSFFEEEKNRIESSIHEIELKISSFKEKHINELPELMQINVQDVHSIEISIEKASEELRGLKEKEASQAAELASVSPQIADQEKLSSLRLELDRLTTQYSNEYPDVIHVKQEIAEIEKNQSEKGQSGAASGEGKATNPAYITLSSQLGSTRSEIATIKQQIAEYEKQRKTLHQYIKATPGVDQEYKGLLMERDSLNTKYNDLMQKFMEARVAQGLEKDQKGERFTLIDPALLPEKPFKPHRLVIFLVGLILGVAVSIGLTALTEMADDTIRDGRILSLSTHIPVLSVIPVIYTDSELLGKKRRYITAFVLGGVGVVVIPLLFHFFVMDVYVLWAKLMRNLNV